MKLTEKQTEILEGYNRAETHNHRGEQLTAVSIWGSHEHRSMNSLVGKGLVSVGYIQPNPSAFVFATRKGQALGIGENLSLTLEERSEKEVTLSINDRYHLREALKDYKQSFSPGWDKRIAKLNNLLAD